MTNSQNGWPVLASNSNLLHRWIIPTESGEVGVTLRNGSAGFLLCHLAIGISDWWEPMKQKLLDDWGYAARNVRGSATDISNHASGTALDFNATKHVLGKAGTWSPEDRKDIEHRLGFYGGVIRWGADYQGRKDEMHFEIVATMTRCEKVARSLIDSDRGKKILAVNPGQRAVILS